MQRLAAERRLLCRPAGTIARSAGAARVTPFRFSPRFWIARTNCAKSWNLRSGAAIRLKNGQEPVSASPVSPVGDRRESDPAYPNKRKTMGLFSKDIKSMDDLFVHTLQDIYYAEN